MAFGTVNVPGVTAKELRDVSDIANAAKVAAEGVQDIANSAQSTANAALERANAADTNANAAKSTADEALEKPPPTRAPSGRSGRPPPPLSMPQTRPSGMQARQKQLRRMRRKRQRMPQKPSPISTAPSISFLRRTVRFTTRGPYKAPHGTGWTHPSSRWAEPPAGRTWEPTRPQSHPKRASSGRMAPPRQRRFSGRSSGLSSVSLPQRPRRPIRAVN